MVVVMVMMVICVIDYVCALQLVWPRTFLTAVISYRSCGVSHSSGSLAHTRL